MTIGQRLRRAGRVVALTIEEMKGTPIHEPPTIPNQFDWRLDSPLTEGLVVTIEPIIAAGRTESSRVPTGGP